MQTLQRTGVDLYVHSNGITLCYDDFGEGTVLVIFIHGFPFEKSSWHSQMGFFQKTDRVLAYDIRGFGKSTIGPERSSINLFADDLIHFMNALNIKKSIICGLSIGGYIAMNAVCRYPGRFKAIILSDTQCIADSNEMKEQRKETVLNITANGLNYFSDEYIKNAFCKETLETKKELVMEVKEVILSNSPLVITRTLRALADRKELCSSLKEISVPGLIICGREDTITPPSRSEFLCNDIKHSKLQIIENAGHLPNLEQPDIFNMHLADFLNSLEE